MFFFGVLETTRPHNRRHDKLLLLKKGVVGGVDHFISEAIIMIRSRVYIIY